MTEEKNLTKQQQLILNEIKLLIELQVNRLQQVGMDEEDAKKEVEASINRCLMIKE